MTMLFAAAVSGALLFHAPFENSAEAVSAGGECNPLVAEGLEFVPGKKGMGIRLTEKAKSKLEYAARGNLNWKEGTFSCWVRREWGKERRYGGNLFATAPFRGSGTPGTGALHVWWSTHEWFRADVNDKARSHSSGPVPCNGKWEHIAVTWKDGDATHYVNGMAVGAVSDSYSPMRYALNVAAGKVKPKEFPDFAEPERFAIGALPVELAREQWRNFPGGVPFKRLDGIVDEARIYGRALSAEEIRKDIEADGGLSEDERRPWSEVLRSAGENKWTGGYAAEPGVPDGLELLEEVVLDEAGCAKMRAADRMAIVGEQRFGELDGKRYFELGPNVYDRVGFRFDLPDENGVYYFEVFYPDDKKRTAEVNIYNSAPQMFEDYGSGCGYATGGDLVMGRRFERYGSVFWACGKRACASLMNWRANEPGAVRAIRLYRIAPGKLPAARIEEPKANGGWNRTFALYYEDPSIGYDFGTLRTRGREPDELLKMVDRCAAYMKFTGQNMLCYPEVWYAGQIGEYSNPRNHAADFMTAFCERFDREGLMVMSTFNPNTTLVEKDLVTAESMTNGTLHSTWINIHNTGKPNWGGWHGTAPNFNFGHPKTQAEIRRLIFNVIDRGAKYKSFKGICLHMTAHDYLMWGTHEGGYNDYNIEAFERDTGVKLKVDRKDPLRGKAYYEWLKANCWERWIGWRCEQVTKFYSGIASEILSRRSDLRLWINTFTAGRPHHPKFMTADYPQAFNREQGLDSEALGKVPGIVLAQSFFPIASRQGRFRRPLPKGAPEKFAELDRIKETWDFADACAYPVAGQHDNYWESDIGRSKVKPTLDCSWTKDHPWRVSTINFSGRNFLRTYAAALRHRDILGFTKGGFLVGTIGVERYIAPFMQAFRALPAVKMADVSKEDDLVRVRHCTWDGKSWFYAVNTDERPRTVRIEMPAESKNLADGRKCCDASGWIDMRLDAYEMKSFSAPSGKPAVDGNSKPAGE